MADALRILVTGFEPFGGSPVNPSAMAAESLAHGRFPGTEVRVLVLPVVGGTEPGSARAALDAMLEAFPADAAIHFGEAHVRGEVSVERVAVNLRDYRIADNSGAFAEDSPVVADAADARFATLPVRAIVDAVRAEGIPAGLSLSSARTQWGSCTHDGRIRLNWRLIHFALPVIDYVVAHELAHLKEMNHGPRFWNTVAELLPGFEEAREQIRGVDLSALG
jgi:pyrrolidone-carboxylate peptidase